MLLIFVAVKDSMCDSSRLLGRCMPRAQIKELRVLGGRSSRDTVSISKLLFYWIFWEELLRCWSKKVTFVLHCPSLLSHFHHSWRYQKTLHAKYLCQMPIHIIHEVRVRRELRSQGCSRCWGCKWPANSPCAVPGYSNSDVNQNNCAVVNFQPDATCLSMSFHVFPTSDYDWAVGHGAQASCVLQWCGL